MPKRYLVIDGGNFLSRIYFGHNKEDEEQTIETKINELPSNKSIHIKDLY